MTFSRLPKAESDSCYPSTGHNLCWCASSSSHRCFAVPSTKSHHTFCLPSVVSQLGNLQEHAEGWASSPCFFFIRPCEPARLLGSAHRSVMRRHKDTAVEGSPMR